MKLSNKAYDILKWISLIFCDAVGIFYKTIAGIWGFPYGDEVLTTLAAVGVLIGALIGVSTAQYNKHKGGGDNAE